VRTFRKTCRSFSFFVVLPDYFQKAINALFHVFHELRKLIVPIRCTMKSIVDNGDGLVQGMSRNMRNLLKGEGGGRSDSKDLLRVRIEYSLAEWNNKVSSYSMNTLDNKVTGYRLGIRAVVGGVAICMHPLRICKTSKTNIPISPLKNVRIPTASTCCLCWTIVAKNNSFSKMYYEHMQDVLCNVVECIM